MFNRSSGSSATLGATEASLFDFGVKHNPILALAPNGAYKQKSDHVQIPLSMNEIVQTAIEAQIAGASLLHLHIRDENSLHSLDPGIYQRTIDAIEEQVENRLIIQITSEAAGRFSPDQQIATIQAVNPECVSIALREILPDLASQPAAQALFNWCAEQQCRIQYILYTESDLLSYLEYIKQGIIPPAPHSILFVLGRYSQNQTSTEADLIPFLKHRNYFEAPWMACAFGTCEQKCLLDAASKGGHMRIGFENNLLDTNGHLARDNTQQLHTISGAAQTTGLNLASADEARKILDIR